MEQDNFIDYTDERQQYVLHVLNNTRNLDAIEIEYNFISRICIILNVQLLVTNIIDYSMSGNSSDDSFFNFGRSTLHLYKISLTANKVLYQKHALYQSKHISRAAEHTSASL